MWLQPKVKDISNQYVCEGIGDEYKEWNCNTCVLISTPPGSGKNTFIMDKLVPYAADQGKKVLILSNRVALNAQQKRKMLRELFPYDLTKEQFDVIWDLG